jgi:hypothetical protein
MLKIFLFLQIFLNLLLLMTHITLVTWNFEIIRIISFKFLLIHILCRIIWDYLKNPISFGIVFGEAFSTFVPPSAYFLPDYLGLFKKSDLLWHIFWRSIDQFCFSFSICFAGLFEIFWQFWFPKFYENLKNPIGLFEGGANLPPFK